jgi:hypothetical protein
MADIKSAYSDYIRFTLKSDFFNAITIEEPIGWADDDLELDRHKDYHGIFTSFTNDLKFTDESLNYILAVYDIGGINSTLRLEKDILRDIDGEVKFINNYSAIADFGTLVINEDVLSIKFNSNNLAELLKSHETDEFEIERVDSIDGVLLPKLNIDNVEIKGRSIVQTGESQIKPDTPASASYMIYSNNNFITPPTILISEGPPRHQAVRNSVFPSASTGWQQLTAEHFFYIDSGLDVIDSNLSIKYDLEFEIKTRFANQFGPNKIEFRKYKYNNTTSFYELVNINVIFNESALGSIYRKINGVYNTVMKKNEAMMLVYTPSSPLFVFKQHLVLNEIAFYNPSPSLNFIFTHDLLNRLMYIITSKNNVFYSKYLGRKEIGYVEDGKAGLIGVISGLWARAFNSDSEKYKSLTISPKDVLDSLHAVFNTGVGIENKDFGERLRVEPLAYFYQDETVVKLPFQISKVKRKVDNTLFFSGLEFGYERGGDYEDSMGLDEPNTRVNYVTPIRKSNNKFNKVSKLRTDEYGLEIARRKPQSLFPNEDTRYDESNWLLDLKRTVGAGYAQMNYTDRLKELPIGIHSPETYRSMYFTPLRMMFRHSWVFRSGLEKYLDKFIKYTSARSNSLLTTWANEDSKPYSEGGDVKCSELSRSKFLPEEVEFEHPVDDDLMDLIMGTTPIVINGESENVPNVYFKFEYINERGMSEKGYLLNLKPNKTGKFKMQLCNEIL